MNRYSRPSRLTQLLLVVFAVTLSGLAALLALNPPAGFMAATPSPAPTPARTLVIPPGGLTPADTPRAPTMSSLPTDPGRTPPPPTHGPGEGTPSLTRTPAASAMPVVTPVPTPGPTPHSSPAPAMTPRPTGTPTPVPATPAPARTPTPTPALGPAPTLPAWTPVPVVTPGPTATPGDVFAARRADLPRCPQVAHCRLYQPQEGEYLILIARRFGVRLDALLRLNPSLRDHPSLIYRSQPIRIPD